jgi:competence protein ComEA
VSRSDRILVAAGGAAVVLVAIAVFILLVPTAAAPGATPTADPALGLLDGTPSAGATPASGQPAAGTIFVDIEGAIAEPGIRELPAGSRVADGIAAAGGYASDADLEAAATVINLAQPLTDGQQVVVPRIGEAEPGPESSSPATGGGGSVGGATDGLVNLNTATPEELEALPGIGPVTVQKIVAARQEQPFTSLEDAVARGVAAGEFRDVDPRLTALAVFGLCNWAYQWYRPGGALSTDALADFFFDLLLNGLGRDA